MKRNNTSLSIIALLVFALSGCAKASTDSKEHQHTFSSLINERSATCVADGTKAHYECEICGQLFDANKNETTLESLTINKLNHDLLDGWYEADGAHYHKCSRCDEKVDAHSHELIKHDAHEPSHVTKGNVDYWSCEECGYNFLDSNGLVSIDNTDIQAVGHDLILTHHDALAPTCTEAGHKEYYTCSCGAMFEDANGKISINAPITVPVLGHHLNSVWNSNGEKHWRICDRCGEKIEESTHVASSYYRSDHLTKWHECEICGLKLEDTIEDITGCHHDRLVHYEALSPTLSKPGHIAFYYCFDCDKSFRDYECLNVIENTNYGLNNKLDGRYLSPLTGVFNILRDNLRNYLSAQSDAEVIAALADRQPYNDQADKKIYLHGLNNGPYTVEISNTRSFDEYKSFVLEEEANNYVFEKTLIPGETYYYRVKDCNNNYAIDDLSFFVDDTYSLRTLGVEGVNNVRDLGGWTAKDGNKVLYGKLYRGGKLENITDEGKEVLLDSLGVKTEIDLRKDGTSELIDSRLTYEKHGMWMYGQIIPGCNIYTDDFSFLREYDPESPVAIKEILELLADDSVYPVYYHCISGADRTGTLSYIINGLLGVSYEDLTKDFELTTFSAEGNRYRSKVVNNAFDEIGLYENSNTLFIGWGHMHNMMQLKYGEEGKPLYVTIENYLKTVCNISDETIAEVRRNLLGKEVDFSNY